MTLARTPMLPSLILASLALIACSSDPEPSGPQGGTGGTPAAGAGGTPAAGTGGTPAAGTGGTPAAGTGGTGPAGSGGTGGMLMGMPASDSAADLRAFLEAGTYRNAPWRAETAMPRDTLAGSVSSHMGKVRVWMNAPLVDSLKNGRTGQGMAPKADPQSMAVKELYDDAGTNVVARAVIYRSGAAADAASYVFACLAGSEPDRCGTMGATANMLIYGRGMSDQGCFFCHSPNLQTFYTPPPP